MRTIRTLLFAAVLAPSLFADTYIAVYRPQPGVAEPVLSDYHATLVLEWDSREVIRMAPADAARLRDHPRVRYVQRIQDPQGTSPSVLRVGADAFRPEVTAALPDWSTGTYSYDGVGNIVAMSDDGDHKTRLYTYDVLNRLRRMENGLQYFEYTYDGFGNRVSKRDDVNGRIDWDAYTSNNQLTTAHYNAIGSVDQFNGSMYAYDNANMMSSRLLPGKTVAEVAIYTADDERIARCDSAKCDWTVRGPDQKVRRELESQSILNEPGPQYWLWIEDYVYRNGQLLGAQREVREGGRRNFHLDHLGTPRVTTGSGGQQLARSEYEPFGEEITNYKDDVTVNNFERPEPMRFTGHQRDFLEGAMYEDYMHARYYTPGAGRFLSVDPVAARPTNPQSWNRYSYTDNDPLSFVDPNGKAKFHPESSSRDGRWIDHINAHREKGHALIANAITLSFSIHYHYSVAGFSVKADVSTTHDNASGETKNETSVSVGAKGIGKARIVKADSTYNSDGSIKDSHSQGPGFEKASKDNDTKDEDKSSKKEHDTSAAIDIDWGMFLSGMGELTTATRETWGEWVFDNSHEPPKHDKKK